MNPKDKATELVDKFRSAIKEYPAEIYPDDIEHQTSIQCVIIAVEEIIKSDPQNEREFSDIPFWEEVKNELNKML